MKEFEITGKALVSATFTKKREFASITHRDTTDSNKEPLIENSPFTIESRVRIITNIAATDKEKAIEKIKESLGKRDDWEIRLYDENEDYIGGCIPDEVKILNLEVEAEELEPAL